VLVYMKRLSVALSVLFLVHMMLPSAALGFDEINKSFVGDIALGGYDAVGYSTEGKALRGSAEFSVEWEGAQWLFANATNRALFLKSPDVYAPQYGGYCSNQMSLGNLSDIDPLVWRVIEGRLYLFGHDAGRVRWKTETRQRIREADSHWLKMTD